MRGSSRTWLGAGPDVEPDVLGGAGRRPRACGADVASRRRRPPPVGGLLVSASPTVLIVEDHTLLAEGLAAAFLAEGLVVHVVDGPSSDVIIAVAREVEPDLVLLDLMLGEEIGLTIPMIPGLRSTGADVLVLTGITDRLLFERAWRRGRRASRASRPPSTGSWTGSGTPSTASRPSRNRNAPTCSPTCGSTAPSGRHGSRRSSG